MKKLLPWLLAALVALVALEGAALAENALTPDILPYSTKDSYLSFGDPYPTPTPGIEASSFLVQPEATEAPWAYPISLELLADHDDLIKLVNKENLLTKEYPAKDEPHALVPLSVRKTSGAAIEGRKIASDALVAMFAAAEADGIKLYVESGYRSYSTQATMYDRRLKSIGKDDGVVQMPGASDHQTGLGFDVISWAWRDSKLNTKFAETAEAKWMAANCMDFGFIIRYPDGKKDITGIMFEPWHLRYVGVEVARYMMDNSLTLEEFTIEWKSAIVAHKNTSGQPSTNQGQGAADSFSF